MKTFFHASLLACAIFLQCCLPLKGQSKFEVSLGGGIPELFNLKLRYGNNLQVSAAIGYFSVEFLGSQAYDWTYTLEGLYHFSGTTKHLNLHTWYVSVSLGYYDFELMAPFGLNYDRFDIAFNPRIGKTFYFSELSGINLDIGLFVPLSKIPIDETYEPDPINWTILPSGSFGFFFRL
jgi:hypothetical protein